jgi:hypothetical protein
MRITTPYVARSTADEVSAGIDLTGKRAVVTGGASGIGVEELVRSVAPYSLDPENAERLWAISAAAVGRNGK